MLQLPEPDLIVQAAGHLNRAHYTSQLGLNPAEWPEFREMAQMLWPDLDNALKQLEEVSIGFAADLTTVLLKFNNNTITGLEKAQLSQGLACSNGAVLAAQF